MKLVESVTVKDVVEAWKGFLKSNDRKEIRLFHDDPDTVVDERKSPEAWLKRKPNLEWYPRYQGFFDCEDVD